MQTWPLKISLDSDCLKLERLLHREGLRLRWPAAWQVYTERAHVTAVEKTFTQQLNSLQICRILNHLGGIQANLPHTGHYVHLLNGTDWICEGVNREKCTILEPFRLEWVINLKRCFRKLSSCCLHLRFCCQTVYSYTRWFKHWFRDKAGVTAASHVNNFLEGKRNKAAGQTAPPGNKFRHTVVL